MGSPAIPSLQPPPAKDIPMPTIRPACPDDLAALLPMVQALARHHGDAAEACLDSLRRDLVGPHPWAEALVAEMQGTLVGYAILARSVQLHFGTRGMDLHHLFVAEPHRSHGIGSALIWAAMAKARAEGCARLTVGTAPSLPAPQPFTQHPDFTPHPGRRAVLHGR